MGVDEEFEEFEEFEGFEEFPPVVLDARRGSANVAPQAHPPQSHPNSSCALSQDIPHSLTQKSHVCPKQVLAHWGVGEAAARATSTRQAKNTERMSCLMMERGFAP